MLLLLAWFLWLHKQQNRNVDADADGDLVIGLDTGVNIHGNALDIVEEDIINASISNEDELVGFEDLTQIDDEFVTATIIDEDETVPIDFNLEKEGIEFSEINLQNDEEQLRQAKLSSQESFKRLPSEDLNVSNASDDFLEHDEVKTAKLLSQISFKKDRGEVKKFQRSPGSPFHNFSPIKTAVDCSNKNDNNSYNEPSADQDNLRNAHHISDLNLVINGSHNVHQNFVSCIEDDVNTIEDNEVEAAFKSETLTDKTKEEEDMHYTALPGTRVHIKKEPAGRIHSIVVTDKKTETKPSRIRCKSPSMRAVSPRMHIETKPHVTEHSEDMVHLVVNTHNRLDVHTDSIIQSNHHSPKQKVPPPVAKKVKQEVVEEFMPVDYVTEVESGNPDFQFQDNVGKLQKQDSKKKAPTFLEKPVAEVTDFDTVMRKRKKMVDTMDDAGRMLGQIAHHDVSGVRNISKNWVKVKEAVRTKKYLSFKDNAVIKALN